MRALWHALRLLVDDLRGFPVRLRQRIDEEAWQAQMDALGWARGAVPTQEPYVRYQEYGFGPGDRARYESQLAELLKQSGVFQPCGNPACGVCNPPG